MHDGKPYDAEILEQTSWESIRIASKLMLKKSEAILVVKEFGIMVKNMKNIFPKNHM
jgi:hypothetical protein